jgi:predicted lysophospholipase L1 biosynthesis ABC-type transport system permease subunit
VSGEAGEVQGIGLLAMMLLMIGVAVLGWRLLGMLTSGPIWSQRPRLGGVDVTRTQWLTLSGFLALSLGVLVVLANLAM